jgi:hypothetical protein
VAREAERPKPGYAQGHYWRSAALKVEFDISPQTSFTAGTRREVIGSEGRAMAERDWVKAIGKKLRDDLGDCSSLPAEMLRLLEELQEATKRSRQPPQIQQQAARRASLARKCRD